VWRTDLGPYHSGHGFGQSPIRYDDLLILPVEHQGESFRAALAATDGSKRWRVPCDSSLHYATPCIRTRSAGGDELIFVNWEQGISGVDPKSGETNWSADVFDKSHVESSISSPVLAGPLVIGVCGWLGHGYEAIAVDPDRQGEKVVWKLDRGAPLCTTPVVVGQYVCFWSDQGVVTCVDASTGEVFWRERVGGSYYSSPVSDGKRILNISTEGEAVILAAASEYRLLARNRLEEGTHATPAIAGSDLFLRTFTTLTCLRGRN
jgi:outer membrane protein assembly factor BamB